MGSSPCQATFYNVLPRGGLTRTRQETRLIPQRKSQGMYMSGERFKIENDWTVDNEDDELNGRLVDGEDDLHC